MFGSDVTTSASSPRAASSRADGLVAAAKRGAGRVRHGWRRATARAPRSSQSLVQRSRRFTVHGRYAIRTARDGATGVRDRRSLRRARKRPATLGRVARFWRTTPERRLPPARRTSSQLARLATAGSAAVDCSSAAGSRLPGRQLLRSTADGSRSVRRQPAGATDSDSSCIWSNDRPSAGSGRGSAARAGASSSSTVRCRSGSLRARASAARYCASASAGRPCRWWISARPRIAARFSGALLRT